MTAVQDDELGVCIDFSVAEYGEGGKLTAALRELKQRRETELRPATAFLSCSQEDQLKCIRNEYQEVLEAQEEQPLKKCGNERLAEELVDLQTACETMLAMLGLDEMARMEVRWRVIEKNKARGYYKNDSKKQTGNAPASAESFGSEVFLEEEIPF